MTEDRLTESDVAASAERAALAELGFSTGEGLACEVLTPLRIGDRACFALSYDRSDLARRLRATDELVIAFSDSRLAYKGWMPLAARVRCDVFADSEGELFSSKLLDQELRKHPPSRALIDTPLMRREHWWYIPRWIVRLVEVFEVRSIERRASPRDGLLIHQSQAGVAAQTTNDPNWNADELQVKVDGDVVSGPAIMMTHDFSIPDLEDRSTYVVAGHLSSDRLRVQRRVGERGLGGRRSLRQRLRDQGQLRRDCIQELRDHGLA